MNSAAFRSSSMGKGSEPSSGGVGISIGSAGPSNLCLCTSQFLSRDPWGYLFKILLISMISSKGYALSASLLNIFSLGLALKLIPLVFILSLLSLSIFYVVYLPAVI